jgi:hypothetical protein
MSEGLVAARASPSGRMEASASESRMTKAGVANRHTASGATGTESA